MRRVYVDQLATMKERELNTLYIDFNHLEDYDAVSIPTPPIPAPSFAPPSFPS